MDNRKIPTNTVTRTLRELDEVTGNIYESINVISKRATEISSQTKVELQKRLLDFAGVTDNLEEVFENREQIEISKYYERLPKATLIASEEFLDGKLKVKRATIKKT